MAADLEFDFDTAFAKNPNYSKTDFEVLKKWVKDQEEYTIIPKDMHDKQLLLFYNACEMKIDSTKKCIKSYYTVRDGSSDQFDNRNFKSAEMKECLESLEYFILPGLTDEGYDVLFHRLHMFEPEKYHLHEACKILFMSLDACLYKNGPQRGFVFLFDMKGVKLGHIARCPISGIAKFCQYVQEALPVNMKAMHIMNTNSFIDKILFLMKPFLKKEIMSMIKLHSVGEDMEKFYSECIPRRMLPPDFGGDCLDTRTLHKKNCELLKSLLPYFDAEEQHRNSYSKKSKKKAKLEKGFQDLCID